MFLERSTTVSQKDRDFEAKDNNIEQLKWVKPENIGNNLGQLEKRSVIR